MKEHQKARKQEHLKIAKRQHAAHYCCAHRIADLSGKCRPGSFPGLREACGDNGLVCHELVQTLGERKLTRAQPTVQNWVVHNPSVANDGEESAISSRHWEPFCALIQVAANVVPKLCPVLVQVGQLPRREDCFKRLGLFEHLFQSLAIGLQS